MYRFFVQGEVIFILRMFISAFCGVVLGYERKSRGKSAGVRTHLVVAVASSLMMLISKYGFSDMTDLGVQFSPDRIASTVVSGIGFLGAGMIYIHGKETPRGLTTAAGIWATSGIGLAIGAGMYVAGLSCTAFIYTAQLLLHRNVRCLKPIQENSVTFILERGGDSILSFENIIEKNDIHIEALSMEKINDNLISLSLSITSPENYVISKLMNIAEETDFVKSIEIRDNLK